MAVNLPARRSLILLTAVLGSGGCGTEAVPLHPLEAAPAPLPVLGTRFDPLQSGTVRGRVAWVGPPPQAHSFRDAKVAVPSRAAEIEAKNPHLPRLNDKGTGVRGAVIFLRKVDPARSRPWSLPPVRVEMRDGQIGITQDETESHITGFVKRGDDVEMIAHAAKTEMLRARGAAFFTLAFPEPDRMLKRPLARGGLVELSSATGNFAARSWLFVIDHPYYTRTDADGRFVLDRVPDGTYELACWMPNWRIERFERDVENMYVARLSYAAPLEKAMAVRVEAGVIADVEFTVSAGEFARPENLGTLDRAHAAQDALRANHTTAP